MDLDNFYSPRSKNNFKCFEVCQFHFNFKNQIIMISEELSSKDMDKINYLKSKNKPTFLRE